MKKSLHSAIELDTSPYFGSSLAAEMIAVENVKNGEALLSPEVWNFWQETKSLFDKIVWLKKNKLIDGLYYSTTYFNDEPPYVCFTIRPAHHAERIGSFGVGKSLFNHPAALGKALGEIVERMSIFAYNPSETVRKTYGQLANVAVSPEDFIGATEKERLEIEKTERFKKYHAGASLAFNDDTPFRWVEAKSLTASEKRYVPLQLVSLAPIARDSGEPFIRFPLSTGSAAGQTQDAALLAGVLEVVERDAFMINWLSQSAKDRLDLQSSPKLEKIYEIFQQYRLEFHVVELSTDFSIPVFMGIVIDRTEIGYGVVVGAKAGFDCEEIIESIACDIIHNRHAYRRQKKPASGQNTHIDLRARAHIWRPSEMIAQIEPLISGSLRPIEYFQKRFLAAETLKTTSDRLLYLKNKLRELCLDAYWVDVTAQNLQEIQIPVVVVTIPKLHPLYVDECFPYRNVDRIRSVLKRFESSYMQELPSNPHPFA